jgi:hypothetical protein
MHRSINRVPKPLRVGTSTGGPPRSRGFRGTGGLFALRDIDEHVDRADEVIIASGYDGLPANQKTGALASGLPS